jgi:hypothetical protein
MKKSYPKELVEKVCQSFVEGKHYEQIMNQLNVSLSFIYDSIWAGIKKGLIPLPEGINRIDDFKSSYFNQMLQKAGLNYHVKRCNKGYEITKKPVGKNRFVFIASSRYQVYLKILKFIEEETKCH